MNNLVIIQVEGGRARCTSKPAGLKVLIVDWDNDVWCPSCNKDALRVTEDGCFICGACNDAFEYDTIIQEENDDATE